MAIWPNGSSAIPTVTGEYGAREPIWTPQGWSPSFHWGIDTVWPSLVIHAPISGVVTMAWYNGSAGNEVRIRGDNGDVVRLCHNSRIDVVNGQRVAMGQRVAIMGTTGMSIGVHCHFETLPGGGATVNPRNYIAANSGGGSTPTKEEEEDMNYINISGKAGARRGGSYIIVGRTAVFAGAHVKDLPVISDEGAIATLQGMISGLK